jgi:hypothetical protein
MANAGADPPVDRGRPMPMEQCERTGFIGPAGVMANGMQATGTRRNTGSPSGDRRWINRRLVRVRLGRMGWRRGP